MNKAQLLIYSHRKFWSFATDIVHGRVGGENLSAERSIVGFGLLEQTVLR